MTMREITTDRQAQKLARQRELRDQAFLIGLGACVLVGACVIVLALAAAVATALFGVWNLFAHHVHFS
jgi:hypothetical protein